MLFSADATRMYINSNFSISLPMKTWKNILKRYFSKFLVLPKTAGSARLPRNKKLQDWFEFYSTWYIFGFQYCFLSCNSLYAKGHSTWTKFYPFLTPSSPAREDKHWHLTYYISTLCHVTPAVDFLLTPSPPLLVYVIIECPLNSVNYGNTGCGVFKRGIQN